MEEPLSDVAKIWVMRKDLRSLVDRPRKSCALPWKRKRTKKKLVLFVHALRPRILHLPPLSLR